MFESTDTPRPARLLLTNLLLNHRRNRTPGPCNLCQQLHIPPICNPINHSNATTSMYSGRHVKFTLRPERSRRLRALRSKEDTPDSHSNTIQSGQLRKRKVICLDTSIHLRQHHVRTLHAKIVIHRESLTDSQLERDSQMSDVAQHHQCRNHFAPSREESLDERVPSLRSEVNMDSAKARYRWLCSNSFQSRDDSMDVRKPHRECDELLSFLPQFPL